MAKSKRRKLLHEPKSQKHRPGAPKPKSAPGAPPTHSRAPPPTSKSDKKKKPTTTNTSHAPTPAPPKPTREPTIPFDPYDRILLVGEGDFSFSRALVEHHGCADVTATCLDTEEELYAKYPQTREHVEYLLGEEQRVAFGVDATKLGKEGGGGKALLRPMVEGGAGAGAGAGAAEGKKGFDKIAFNFPHVGGKSTDVNRQVRYNQELLVSFFQAAIPLLYKPSQYDHHQAISTAPGQVLVTLFEQPPYTLWNVRDLARHVGLRPVTSSQFDFSLYPGYKHARTLGNIQGKDGEGQEQHPTAVDGEGDPWEDSEDGDDDEGKKKRGGDDQERQEKKRPGRWRGEERKARMYVFESATAASNNGGKDGGKGGKGGSKKGRKRRVGSSSSSDDDD